MQGHLRKYVSYAARHLHIIHAHATCIYMCISYYYSKSHHLLLVSSTHLDGKLQGKERGFEELLTGGVQSSDEIHQERMA